jgi:hypothetical protein
MTAACIFDHVRTPTPAAHCMEEGIITDAGEADFGSVPGWAFPAFTGGVLTIRPIHSDSSMHGCRR